MPSYITIRFSTFLYSINAFHKRGIAKQEPDQEFLDTISEKYCADQDWLLETAKQFDKGEELRKFLSKTRNVFLSVENETEGNLIELAYRHGEKGGQLKGDFMVTIVKLLMKGCKNPNGRGYNVLGTNDDGTAVFKVRSCECCDTVSHKMKKCSGCEDVSYCSKECQAKNWKEHKKVCKAH